MEFNLATWAKIIEFNGIYLMEFIFSEFAINDNSEI